MIDLSQRRGGQKSHLRLPIFRRKNAQSRLGFAAVFVGFVVLIMTADGHTEETLAGRNIGSAKIGIVYIHGTGSSPEMQHDKEFYSSLREAGYLVEAPEMCWSARRMYDQPYSVCVKVLLPAIAKLKNSGAEAIVMAGHSFGGNVAIQYGATHTGLLGVMVVSAAFDPRDIARDWEVRADIVKAQELIAKGSGDTVDSFPFTSAKVQLRRKATVYLSFCGPNSVTYMPANTPKLTAPLLWISGDRDFGQAGPGYAFNKAPANPLNRYVMVSGNHVTALHSGVAPALAWLDEIGRVFRSRGKGAESAQ
jgi:pimeloyl-ACP methyl ester carboxylesterase